MRKFYVYLCKSREDYFSGIYISKWGNERGIVVGTLYLFFFLVY